MALPSKQEIRTQLFVIIGFATVALSATTFFLEMKAPTAAAILAAPQVNWEDVNLLTGTIESPEETVKTSRSKMLGDFEAR